MNVELEEKQITDSGWCEPAKIPVAFVRRDGARMSINPNKTYSWDHQKADPEHIIYEYHLKQMMRYIVDGNFTAEYEL